MKNLVLSVLGVALLAHITAQANAQGCNAGEYEADDNTCQPCTPIENLNVDLLGDITCFDATTSTAQPDITCHLGYFLKVGAYQQPPLLFDTCEPCTPIEHYTEEPFCESELFSASFDDDGKLGCEPGHYFAYDRVSFSGVVLPYGTTFPYGMSCNECTANNEHVASWRPHVQPEKCWELSQYDEEVCGGTAFQPCYEDNKNTASAFVCEKWERCGVYCGFDSETRDRLGASNPMSIPISNQEWMFTDRSWFLDGIPSFVVSVEHEEQYLDDRAAALEYIEVQCIPQTCDSGFEVGLLTIGVAHPDPDSDPDEPLRQLAFPSCVPSPPIASSPSNDSSSNSSKDEGKYIFLFVCVGFVLGGLVAAALYAAGCIGSKAGADVSALPTKAPVKAVEFTTTAQETA